LASMAGTRVRPSLPGTNYDNEGKPIAHLGREVSEGALKFAGTASRYFQAKPGRSCRRK
jgi:hypothetical protein